MKPSRIAMCYKVALFFLVSNLIHFIFADDSNYYNDEKELLSMNRLNDLVETLEKNLSNIHKEYTNMDILSERDDRVVVENVNIEMILEKLEYQITELINDKKRSLKRIVEALEEASKDYVWQDKLDSNFNDSVFMNTTADAGYEDISGVMDDLLGIKVNRSVSGIHIPVEIYEGYPEIVNGLSWSSVVDETFKNNAASDPTLPWQFFSSHKGFTRFYPSVTKWDVPPPYSVDLFDSRRRPWYIQATSSPKDVIVLLDRSGSVHGQTFTIMKFAVETLIDTLGENDFANVAAFNETTSWASEIVNYDSEEIGSKQCSTFNESLIQATNVNKKALAADTKLVTARGIANYTDALLFAYEVFRKRSENGESSANCHKLIMLFSDGGTQWPEEVIKKYQNDSSTSDVRIFTYAVGPHPTPTAVLKDMACYTGGRHTVITTSSGVRSKIQDSYIDIISEGLASSDKHPYHYTSAYTSALTNNLTITVTLPVFNLSTTMFEQGKSELLGVAGVDIPIPLLDNLVPRETLGPLGYVIMLNRNGLLAMHSRIHPQKSYLEDALHLDILDVEFNKVSLVRGREKMIMGHNADISFQGPILIDKEHIFNGRKFKKYTFVPILDSAFSLGIFSLLPSSHLKVTRSMPFETIDPRTSLLAPWNFCGTHQAMPKPDLTNLRMSNAAQCDRDLLNAVMWAQEWTNGLIQQWEQQFYSRPGVINKAVFTRFGLARIVARFGMNETNIASSIPYGLDWRDPAKNPALKRSLLKRNLDLYPHVGGAYISRPAYMYDVVAAVVGVNVTSGFLDDVLAGGLEASFVSPNNTIIMMVDESATIIASSRYEKSSGEFLGTRWPLLLEKLVEAEIFGRQNITDFQALCEDPYSVRSRVNSARPLFRITLDSPIQFVTKIFFHIIALMEYLQCCLMHGFFTTSIWANPPSVNAIYKADAQLDACIVQRVVYYFTDKQEFSGNISCFGDSAQVLVKRMNSTNAIVIALEHSMVNFNCDGWRERPIIPTNPSLMDSTWMRTVHPKEIACQKPRTRKPTTECEMSPIVHCKNDAPNSSSKTTLLLLGLVVAFIRAFIAPQRCI